MQNSILAILLLGAGIVAAIFLGVSLNQALRWKPDILRRIGKNALERQARSLMVFGGLAAVVLAVLVVFVFQGEKFARASHAVFLLGMWMTLTLLAFEWLILARSRHRPSLFAFAGLLLGLAAVIYLTPIGNFLKVFQQGILVLPLVVGAGLVAAVYFWLTQVKRVVA